MRPKQGLSIAIASGTKGFLGGFSIQYKSENFQRKMPLVLILGLSFMLHVNEKAECVPADRVVSGLKKGLIPRFEGTRL